MQRTENAIKESTVVKERVKEEKNEI